MATITAIMDAIEAALTPVEKLRVSAEIPDQINPYPGGGHAIVGVPSVPDYHRTMANRARYIITPTVTVLTSAALDRRGQRALAAFADPSGPSSIAAALETDQTLGGVVENCIVMDFRPLGLEEVGEIGYYGGVFTLRITARGA
jgi:hypothetical protein